MLGLSVQVLASSASKLFQRIVSLLHSPSSFYMFSLFFSLYSLVGFKRRFFDYSWSGLKQHFDTF